MEQYTLNIKGAPLTLAKLFAQSGVTLYAVGGMVRNPLLGLPVSDMDITSAMPPEDVLHLCENAGYHCFEKGIAFGAVEIHVGKEVFEHTTFRSDTYADGGAHRPSYVKFASTMEEDAFRRDFTVNALYVDILGEDIIDPTGGLNDVKAGIIRATSPDPNVIMRDDGLRVLRMARFAAELGFGVDDASFEAGKRNVEGLMDISGERIRDELNKILLSDVRYGSGKKSLTKALFLLRDIGAIKAILPELYSGKGVEQKNEYHAYDVLDHMLHTTAAIEPRLDLRLAALLHDIGKPVTVAQTGKMVGHEEQSAILTESILRRLRYPNDIIKAVVALVRHHMYDLSGNAKEPTLRKKFAGLGYEFSMDLATVREADVHGSGIIKGDVKSAKRWRDVLTKMRNENAPFGEDALMCDGDEIMDWLNLQPSPEVGKIKKALLAHCAVYPLDNTPERLKAVANNFRRTATCVYRV